MNKVILMGNLTREIEMRYLPSGSAVANTSIATNRKFKKQDGSQGEEVCFVELSIFGRTAEIANQYLQKGAKVLIEGGLKLDQWTDQQGQKRSRHSVQVENLHMIGSKQDGQHQPPPQQPQQPPQYEVYDEQGNMTKQGSLPQQDFDDDEIPF